jgi:hypothetical protein
MRMSRTGKTTAMLLLAIPLLLLTMPIAGYGQGYIDVEKITSPTSDTGRFDVLVDGTIMPGGANMGNGAHSGSTPFAAGTHTVTEQAHPGSGTDMANYKATFGGACAPNGTIVLANNASVECTITNTHIFIVHPPPVLFPPFFSLPSGSGACPYQVSLAAIGATAIFFTTNSTTPTRSSTQYTGPITVDGAETITAISTLGARTAGPVAHTYACSPINTIQWSIQTGDDDARTDSALQATLVASSGTTMWCLKPSNNNSFQSCPKSKNGVTWGNFSINSSSETLSSPGLINSSSSLTIQLIGFPGFGQSADNWDLQSITLVGTVSGASPGFPTQATVLSLSGSTPPGSGTCYARFKHPHGEQVSTVVFNFTGAPVIVMDDNGPHTAPYCPD